MKRNLFVGVAALAAVCGVISAAHAQVVDLRSGGATSQNMRSIFIVPDGPASVEPGSTGVAQPGVILDVPFALGSAELSAIARAQLDVLAGVLLDPVLLNAAFYVEGHTDATGSRATNMVLAQARAESVKTYLSIKGVAANRLIATGFGPDRPMPGLNAYDPRNRRVAIVRIG